MSGTAPIIVHRLLKNSITADEYILMTEFAMEDLMISEDVIEPGSEDYDELGKINTFTYYPPLAETFQPESVDKFPQVFVDTLRSEVAKEYSVVAINPQHGFHFHTGRRLAKLPGNDEELLNQFLIMQKTI